MTSPCCPSGVGSWTCRSLHINELLVFLTMNEADCTLQSLWKRFDVSFHVIDITGSRSNSPEAKVATAIGQGTHQVWLANIDRQHWVPVWKQPMSTVLLTTCTSTNYPYTTTTTLVLSLRLHRAPTTTSCTANHSKCIPPSLS